MFAKGVRTPEALNTAPRLRAPVPGKPWTKEFATLATPMAINSWVASTGLPLAACKKVTNESQDLDRSLEIYLQNALQIAMFSIKAIKGTTISPDPKLETISAKLSSLPVPV